MYLSELKLWNFRKYGIKNGEAFDKAAPSLDVHFQNGVNVLIGENDLVALHLDAANFTVFRHGHERAVVNVVYVALRYQRHQKQVKSQQHD